MREDTRTKTTASAPVARSAKESGKKAVGKSIKTKFQLAVIAVLGVFFFLVLTNRYDIINRIQAQVDETERSILYQREITENLRRDEAFFRSDEFVRRIAYERLGLIGDNDLIFERRRR